MSTVLIVCTTPDERAEMALQEARTLGYRCIFSGDKADEKLLALADVCYEIDWENWESLLHIAKLEKVDGIVGLCDKAMIPVAKTCQALNLPCSSPESMNRLISKNKFREVQERAGVFYPKYFTATEPDKLEEKCTSLCFPVIVKPVLCSSSFGQTVVYDIDGLKKAFPTAAASSRNMIAYSVFSEKAGILDHVHVAPELRQHLLAEGIDVLRFVGATIFFQALSTLLFVYYYLLGKGKLAFVVCALKDLILPVCMAIGGSMVMGSSYGLWLGLAVAPVLAICLSLVIVYMAYGKEAVPFLIQPEKNMHSYCYDFEITTENAISLSQTVMERLKDNYGDKVQSAFAAMLVEDVLLLIKSKNPADASLYAECTIFLEEKKVTLIFRYNGVFFDTTDCNATLTSFRQYIVSALMEVPDFKTYLVTTGYNRSVISFMV